MSFKHPISIGYFILFIPMVLDLNPISSSQHIKCSDSSVMRIAIIDRRKDMIKAERPMCSYSSARVIFFFLREERFIYIIFWISEFSHFYLNWSTCQLK